MPKRPIYMDCHATTPVDPRVVETMLPYFSQRCGNSGSVSHAFGWEARDAVEHARRTIAQAIGAAPNQIVFTSGATESNNLAIRGVAERPRRRGNHLLSVATEHKAVLDPLHRLARRGYELTLLSVKPGDEPGDVEVGRVTPRQVAEAIRDDTVLVSVMLANNEIGTIQPLAEIAAVCREKGVVLHCDATQAVGKIPLDVERFQVDLMSFTAHKMYGPKGTGALYVRRRNPQARLEPQITGGGQEHGLRGGTLNVPGIVGLGKALELSLAEMADESRRLIDLRQRLHDGLTGALDDVALNGPPLGGPDVRLPGNVNLCFAGVDGEALMMSVNHVAVSSGSACTSANPEPSHVLRALGLSDDEVRGSIRFGLGRFNTVEEVDCVVESFVECVHRLRRMIG